MESMAPDDEETIQALRMVCDEKSAEIERLRFALKDVLSWYISSFDENTLSAERESVRAASELLQ